MTSALPLAVEHYLTAQRLSRTVAHVLVDSAGEVATSGGALAHFGLSRSDASSIVDMFTPWFESSAVPEDRVSVPFVEIDTDTFAHVHFVDDGELTWIVLVDCSSEAQVEQFAQQRRLEPFLFDLRAQGATESADLGSVLRALEIGTFARSDDGRFLTVGHLPSWLELADESLLQDQRIEPSTHAVLQYFLPEAEQAWTDSGPPVPSFVWNEELTTGEVVHIQAVAIAVPENDVLLLRRLFDEEVENSGNVQRANNQALLAADAERRLYNESQRLQVTLTSIADAVLTTDRHGRVEFMNPMAERLTGWRLPAAAGLPSERVLNLVDESTEASIESPVAAALANRELARSEKEAMLIARDGQRYGVQNSAAPIFDEDKKLVGVVVVLHDVTETRALVREARHQAEHDPLTGLANRREFSRRLEHAMAVSERTGDVHTICYLDLDKFKAINDSGGHQAGDAALQHVAVRLQSIVRSGDTLARVGGDEFCVLLENCGIEAAERVAAELVAVIDGEAFEWQSLEHTLGVSIGIAEVTGRSQSLAEVMALADRACYVAKGQHGSAIGWYDAAHNAMRLSSRPSRSGSERWER